MLHKHHRDERLPGAGGHEGEGVSENGLLHDALLVDARRDGHQLGVIERQLRRHARQGKRGRTSAGEDR